MKNYNKVYQEIKKNVDKYRNEAKNLKTKAEVYLEPPQHLMYSSACDF